MDLCVKENIDYVCFLNHDDFWYPNHLEEIAKLVNNDKTDFIITKSTYKNGYLPRITSNDKYIDFLPVPCGVIHSSVCMNIKTIHFVLANDFIVIFDVKSFKFWLE